MALFGWEPLGVAESEGLLFCCLSPGGHSTRNVACHQSHVLSRRGALKQLKHGVNRSLQRLLSADRPRGT